MLRDGVRLSELDLVTLEVVHFGLDASHHILHTIVQCRHALGSLL